MPDLPTFTVTTAQATRLLAVFGSPAKYKAWLREQIKREVVAHESREAADVAAAAARAIDADVTAILS